MQVDPIKPTLKAPGANLLTLNGDEPLSTLAFKLKLRRYAEEEEEAAVEAGAAAAAAAGAAGGGQGQRQPQRGLWGANVHNNIIIDDDDIDSDSSGDEPTYDPNALD